jgi:PTH1 family peptidyl-tRNA hydrolase
MKLIVGLGNPGKEYANTRHNIGWYCLDKFLGDVDWTKKFNSAIYETNINGEKYIFVKPLTYMNLSGNAVGEIVNFYKLDYKDILVIQDDLDMECGKVRLKINSSAGGHNGIKDIIAHLHTEAFARIKIGVSHDRSIDTKDYVLGKLSKEDNDKIEEVKDIVMNILDDYFKMDFDSLMAKYNHK